MVTYHNQDCWRFSDTSLIFCILTRQVKKLLVSLDNSVMVMQPERYPDKAAHGIGYENLLCSQQISHTQHLFAGFTLGKQHTPVCSGQQAAADRRSQQLPPLADKDIADGPFSNLSCPVGKQDIKTAPINSQPMLAVKQAPPGCFIVQMGIVCLHLPG